MQFKLNKNRFKQIIKLIPILGVLLLSGYFFYLSFTYKDILYSVIGFIIAILFVTLFGKIGFLNRQISLAFHKALFLKVKGFKRPDISGRLNKEDVVSFSKREEYKFLLIVAVGFLLVHTYISSQYTINLLNAPQSIGNQQPFMLYLSAVWQQLPSIWEYELIPVVSAICITVILYFIRRKNKRRATKGSNIVGYTIVSTIVILFLYVAGAFTVIEYAKIIAYSNIDNISSKLNSSKDAKSLNIIADDKELLDSLKGASSMPKIIGNSDKLNETILLSVINKQSNRSSFYQQILLPAAISTKKVSLKTPGDVFLLPDGSLVIKELKKETIESVSPTLGRLMVRGYFNPKYIKEEPHIQVMGRQEYLKFREDQINKQLAEIGKYIANAQSLINSTYANINEDKQKIETNKEGLASSISTKDSDYNNCKTAGYTSFYFGTFSRYYTDSECDTRRQKWDQIIAGFQKNITDWEQSLKTDQYNLGEYQKAKDLLVKYRDLVATQKDNAPGELGIFESPDKIKVVLESTSDRAIADYFAIVVHEYLHYTSYVSEERSLPQFFEEGLTEYYSRQIVADQIKTETNVGYPAIVPIIKKIAQDLPKEELERVYFTKDEKLLIALLNKKYGDSFYKDSEYYFKIIPFLGGSDVLEIVNNILFKIDAPQLTEKDLYSESSSFGEAISK